MSKILCSLILMSILFLHGCGEVSEESLTRKALGIMEEITDVINSISDDDSAEAAIPELKTLMERFNETRDQLIESFGKQDITSKFGMQMYSHTLKERAPALERLGRMKISNALVEEIKNIISSGGYEKAKRVAVIQNAKNLQKAIEEGNYEMAKLYLENEADPYLKNDEGLDSFQLAEEYNREDISELLESYKNK